MGIKKISDRFSDRNRLRKFNIFMDYFKPDTSIKLLDIGASEREYQKNANLLEKRYSYPENITVLGIDEYKDFLRRYSKVKTVTYQKKTGRFLSLIKSLISVGVMRLLNMSATETYRIIFLKEIHRVAKASFIATPNRYFPIEMHTKLPLLHYLPKNIFVVILKILGLRWAMGIYLLGIKDIKRVLN